MSFKTLSAILRGYWLIEPNYVQHNLPLIAGLLSGKPVEFGLTEKEDEKGGKDVTQFYSANLESQAYRVGNYTNLDAIPKGSIAIVNMYGPVLKYGDMCTYGMIDKANLLNKIEASGKFKSVLLDVDSPGGQASGTQLLADTIKRLSLPVIAVVNDGMMASAAMWIGAACDEIYATTLTDSFGSIGGYTTIYDFNAYLEKQGIKVHEIYADPSSDKNKPVRDALKNDYTAIKEDINFLVGYFINSVKDDRGDRLNTKAGDPFTGKMFSAEKALEIGLIDGIKPFSEVLAHADTLGEKSTKRFNSNTQMFGNKFKTLASLAKVAASAITAEQMEAVNKEVEAAEISGVSFVLDSELETANKAAAENESLHKQLKDKDAQIETLQSQLAEKDKTIGDQKKKLDGASESNESPKEESTDKQPGDGKEDKMDFSTSVDAEAKALWG